MFIPQAMLPLVALVYASGIVRDEQEEQTITYLLIRPIPKWAFYSVKLLATLTTTVVLTAALTALVYAAIYVGATPSGENIAVALSASRLDPCPGRRRLLLPVRTDQPADETGVGGGVLYAVFFEGLAGESALQHSPGDGDLLHAADRLPQHGFRQQRTGPRG